MGYSQSPLATKSLPTKESNPRDQEKYPCIINRGTIHHMAGRMTAEQCAIMHLNDSHENSANYYVGYDGSCVSGALESERSWCSGSRENDYQAITIEVSNDIKKAPWTISQAAYDKLIALCADVCRRNGLTRVIEISDQIDKLKTIKEKTEFANNYKVPKGTMLLTQHCYFQNTACPGPSIKAQWKQICADINKALGTTPAVVQPTPAETVIIEPANTKYTFNKVDYGPVFNASFYGNKYPDVVKVFGTGSQNLFKHFCEYGMNEGRQGNAEFNVQDYKSKYSDLVNAYGDKMINYYTHYCLFGLKEGRSSGETKPVEAKTEPVKAEAPKAEPAKTVKYKVTAKSGLNVRKGPATSYAWIKTLPYGTTITFSKTQGNWGFISAYNGWVCMDYVQKS